MLVQYKKDYEKTAMGLLSYLPDFKNFANLKDEMKLINDDTEFNLLLFRNKEANVVGVVGIQSAGLFIVIRYLSLAPGFREEKYEKEILQELKESHPKKKIAALPEYTYVLKLVKNKDDK